MQNGNGMNGAAPGAPHMVQLNPMQAAAFGLQLLADVPHTRAQREGYDMAVMLLQAIASGQVNLAPVAHPAAAAQAPAADAAPPQ